MIEVIVTEEHIANGKRGNCTLCPIALALHEMFPDKLISVGPSICHIGHMAYEMPEKAVAFIRDVDFNFSGKYVAKPFRFVLSEGKPSTYWL